MFAYQYNEECLTRIKAMAMLLAAMALAGSSVVVGKMLVVSLPVFLTAFSSLLVALCCMLPLMVGRFAELRRLTQREWGYLMLQGWCGIVLFRVLTLYGLHFTGAVQAGLITGATPAVLALLSATFLGERFTRCSVLAIVLAVAGCLAINFDIGSEPREGHLAGGVLVGAAVVCEALFTIFRKRISASVAATTNTFVLICSSLLLLAPPAAVELIWLELSPSSSDILAVFYYGAFATVVAYLLWTAAVGQVSGMMAGVATAAMPVTSVFLAMMVLGEQPHLLHLAGALLVIAAILVLALAPSPLASTIQGGDRNSR
jgi:drug/metabolite transporter (DMT)-like permease